MKIGIIGSGYVGYNLYLFLKEKEKNIFLIENLKEIENMDIIILCFYNWNEQEENISSLINIQQKIDKKCKIIFISSIVVYSLENNQYIKIIKQMEKLLQYKDNDFVILRCGNIWGGFLKKKKLFINKMINDIIVNKTLSISNYNNNNIKYIIHIKDLYHIIDYILVNNYWNNIINCFTQNILIKDIIKIIEKEFENNKYIKKIQFMNIYNYNIDYNIKNILECINNPILFNQFFKNEIKFYLK